MLLHAKARWPSAVHLCLWPYAVRMAVYIFNTAPVLLDGKSRIELFSGVNVGFRMKDNHVFGCPVFALQNDLASGNTIPKWSPRSRLGLNLGPSPSHARTVNLVLNLHSGLVSPQFHCRYDDFFETTQHSHQDVATQANWKQLAGFVKYDGAPTVQDRLSRSTQLVAPIRTSSTLLHSTQSSSLRIISQRMTPIQSISYQTLCRFQRELTMNPLMIVKPLYQLPALAVEDEPES